MPLERRKTISLSALPDEIRKIGAEFQLVKEKIFADLRRESLREARRLTRQKLPSGGGSYLESIHFVQRSRGDDLIGALRSDHQWAIAVEIGGGPTRPTKKKAFAISGDKSPYMAQRIFKIRNRPRGFHIFRDTFKRIAEKVDEMVIRRLNEAGFT